MTRNAARWSRIATRAGAGLALAVLAGACKKEPPLTCRVNEQCFICPDAKAKSACVRDPTTSRCRWAEPSRCK